VFADGSAAICIMNRCPNEESLTEASAETISGLTIEMVPSRSAGAIRNVASLVSKRNGGRTRRSTGYGRRTCGIGRNPRRRSSWRSGVIQVYSMKVKPAARAAWPWDCDSST